MDQHLEQPVRRRTMRRVALLTVLLCLLTTLNGVPFARAAVIDPMAVVYNQVVNGDFALVGNGVLACSGTSAMDSTPCSNLYSGSTNLSRTNGSYWMTQSDVDSRSETFNSSVARVTIPSGAKVVRARVYWSGSTGYYNNGGSWASGCQAEGIFPNSSANTKLSGSPSTTRPIIQVGTGSLYSLPVQNYVTESLSQLATTDAQYYSATVDVSSLFTTVSGTVDVTLGNVWAPSGYNCYGGWSLAVVYDFGGYVAGNAASVARNVILYDGHARITSTDYPTTRPLGLGFDGFVQEGTTARIGVTAYEGDAGISGDRVGYTTGSSTSPTYLSNINNDSNNAFVSAAVGGRTPPGSSNDSYNASIDVLSRTVDVPAGTNKLTVWLSSSQDSYMLQNVVLSVPVGAVKIDKSVNGTDDTQTINQGLAPSFNIRVTNIGSAPLSSVSVSDPLAPDCARSIGSLASGMGTTYTCNGPPAADAYTNTATVTGKTDRGTAMTASDTSSVVVQKPVIDLSTSADAVSGPTNGRYTATYTVTARNTGDGWGTIGPVTDTPRFHANYPISSVSWSGQSSGSSSGGGAVELAPAGTRINAGATLTWTVRVEYAVTDPTVGSTCTGSPGAGLYTAVSVLDGETSTTNNTTCLNPSASLSVATGVTSTSGPSASGDYRVTYQVTVRNHGGSSASYGALDLAPSFASNLAVTGAAWSGQASGSATGAGPWSVGAVGTTIASGATHSYAVVVTYHYRDARAAASCAGPGSGLYASASLPDGQEQAGTSDNAACADSPPPPAPALSLTKSASPTTVSSVGERVTYTFAVQNTGNVTVTGLEVTDLPLPPTGALDAPPVCQSTTLEPAARTTCSATYAVSQADLDAGWIKDTATASGLPPYASARVVSEPSSATVSATQAGAVTLTTRATPGTVSVAGTSVTFETTVTNSGNVTLSALDAAQQFTAGAGGTSLTLTCPATSLAPGASATCTGTYAVTQSDIDGGSLAATVTVIASSPTGAQVSAQAPVTVRLTRAPAMTMTKSASSTSYSAPGDVITYSFAVTNTGNTTISGLSTVDTFTQGGSGVAGGTVTALTCPTRTLAPGASTTCTHPYTVTQADIDGGVLANTATTTATSAGGGTVKATSSATVSAARAPSLELSATITPTSMSRAGQQIGLTLLARNTGNVTLSDLSVVIVPETGGRGQLSSIACPTRTLAPGQQTTCTATYLTTQDDIDLVTISGYTRASALAAGASVRTESARVPLSLTADQNPAVAVTTSVSPSTYSSAGTSLSYAFTVTNTGNVTLAYRSLTPTFTQGGSGATSATTCDAASIAPGLSTTCRMTYATVQADLDSGAVRTATDTVWVSRAGAEVSASSGSTTAASQSPALVATTSASRTSVTAAGQSVDLTVVLRNTGNVTLSSVQAGTAMTAPGGPNPPMTCPASTLAPGAQTTCTGRYTVTQADMDATGRHSAEGTAVKVTATGSGLAPAATARTTSTPSTASIAVTQSPALALTTTAEPTSVSATGQVVTYTFTTTNTGNVTLGTLQLVDTFTQGGADGTSGPLTCDTTTLAPGASVTCTHTYTAAQSDIDGGAIKTTATATADSPLGQQAKASSAATVLTARTPGLQVVGSASPTTASAAGQVVTLDYAVTNTGNVTLSGLALTQGFATGGAGTRGAITCPVTTLTPGSTTMCTTTYTVAQSDLDGGSLRSTATATGKDPAANDVTGQASVDVGVTRAPSMTMAASASPAAYAAVRDPVTYTFAITNSGNVTIAQIYNVDTYTQGGTGVSGGSYTGFTCPTRTLAPGESTACTHTYRVTQADLDAGAIRSTGTTTASVAGGGTLEATSSTSVTAAATPALSVTASADPATVSQAGQGVTFSYAVRNIGNVTVSGVSVDHALTEPAGAAAPATCQRETLAPGESTTCASTYAITQSDIDHGSVADTATASGLAPGASDRTSSAPSSTTVAVDATAGLTLSVSTDRAVVKDVGEVVTSTYVVRNVGSLTVTGVRVAETAVSPSLPTRDVTCTPTELAPGEQAVCTSTWTVTQADLDRGVIETGAVASAVDSGDAAVTSARATARVRSAESGGLSVTTSAAPATFGAAGQNVSYTVTVHNAGNVTLTGIAVTDGFTVGGSGTATDVTCDRTSLAPGEDAVCTFIYTTVQADVDGGGLRNTATVTAATPAGAQVRAVSSASVAATSLPDLQLTTSVSPISYGAVGDRLTYTFELVNTGNVTLSHLFNTDTYSLGGVGVPGGTYTGFTCATRTLAPGERATCTHVYTVQQGDLDAGAIKSDGSARVDPPSGAPLTRTSSTTVTADRQPGLAVSVSPNPRSVSRVGEVVDYALVVTNTGNVSLDSVGVGIEVSTALPSTPARPTVVCPTGPIAPGASTTCQASYTVRQDDINAGGVTARAVASADPRGGGERVSSAPAEAFVAGEQHPVGNLVKSASPSVVHAAGDVVRYSFAFRNDGNVTMAATSLTDDFTLGGHGYLPDGERHDIYCDALQLGPGETGTCWFDYTVVQADIDDGALKNTVTVDTFSATGTTYRLTSEASVAVEATPGLSLVASASPTTISAVGDVIEHRADITNTGNQTVTRIAVATGGGGPTLVCPGDTLAPGETMRCVARVVATQADLDRGVVTTPMQATGSAPGGVVASSETSTSTVAAAQDPVLTLAARTSTNAVDHAGQVVDYTFTLTNAGNTTLAGLALDQVWQEPAREVDPVRCDPEPAAGLAPGGTLVCRVSRAATQADLDKGRIEAIATARASVPGGAAVTSSATPTTVTVTRSLMVDATASASPVSVSRAGDEVTYRVVVTNPGNLTLHDLQVDSVFAVGGSGSAGPVVCDALTLAPGASTTCAMSYRVDQADIDGGAVRTEVTVAATGPLGGRTSSTSSTSVTAVRAPAMTFDAAVSPTRVSRVGEVVTTTLSIANTGNTTLSALSSKDVYTVGGVGVTGGTYRGFSCDRRTLAPTQTATCTHTYTVQQGDLDAGAIRSTVTSSLTPPGSAPLSGTKNLAVAVTQSPALTLTSTVTPSTATRAGEVVDYAFTVTNSGTVTLGGVHVDGAFTHPGTASLPATCPPDTLAPGAQLTCHAAYTLTQADIDAGRVEHRALASATAATIAAPVLSAPATSRVDVAATRSLRIVASSDRAHIDAVGQPVALAFVVTNTGTVTMGAVGVEARLSHDGSALSVTCPTGTVAPGTSVTCTAPHTVTQTDLDAGIVGVTATTHAHDPADVAYVSPDSAWTTLTVTASSDISIVTTASPREVSDPGERVRVSYLVTNHGNVTLNAVSVSDVSTDVATLVGVPVSCPSPALAPAASMTCWADTTVSQRAFDDGGVTHTAVARGMPAGGDTEVVSTDSADTVTAAQRPHLVAELTGGPSPYDLTSPVSFALRVTNDGNVTMRALEVVATFTVGGGDGASAFTCDTAAIAPGDQALCQMPYAVRQRDVDASLVRLVADVTGVDPRGERTRPVSSTATLAAAQRPEIIVERDVPESVVSRLGEAVDDTLYVRNTGNVALTDVRVVDVTTGTGEDPSVMCPYTSLQPGGAMTCTSHYVVTPADLDAGSFRNVGTASGQPPTPATVDGQAPPRAVSGPATLDVTAQAQPALEVTGSANPATIVQAEQRVRYAFLVSNVGNVTMTGVRLDAVMQYASEHHTAGELSDPVCEATTLAARASMTCTVDYVTTQDDVEAGSVAIRGVATGTPPVSAGLPETTSPSSGVTVAVDATPGLGLAAQATPAVAYRAGERVTYRFTLTNTGGRVLSGLALDHAFVDPDRPGPAAQCSVTTLEPAEGTTCTATWELTAEDVAAGSLSSRVSARMTVGAADGGAVVTAGPVAMTVRLPHSPAVTLEARAVAPTTPDARADARALPAPADARELRAPADARAVSAGAVGEAARADLAPLAAGATVRYAFTVRNTGDVPLVALRLDDSVLGLRGWACATRLEPGASVTCQPGSGHVVTEAEAKTALLRNDVTLATVLAPGGEGPGATGRVDVRLVVPAVPPPPTPSPTPTSSSPATPTPASPSAPTTPGTPAAPVPVVHPTPPSPQPWSPGLAHTGLELAGLLGAALALMLGGAALMRGGRGGLGRRGGYAGRHRGGA